MWELRTRARVHTSSALMSWAACDRLAKIACTFAQNDREAFWRSRADIIHAKIVEQAWNPKRQSFVESFGGNDLDASVLLMAEVGFLPARDPRFTNTVEALEKVLCDGPYMRRYEAEDDFGRPETALKSARSGSVDHGADRPGNACARAVETLLPKQPVGCFPRDMHPTTGARGTFPDLFEVGIINVRCACSALDDAV